MVKPIKIPEKQGLYDPEFEHDSCGIGFVVNISGKKEHDIIESGITILKNLTHRGGAGSEENTGDGAGILTQIPDKFFRIVCRHEGIYLPERGDYGVGMVFLPKDEKNRKKCERKIEDIVIDEGQTVLGWRTLPINDSSLGSIAKKSMPYIRQIFIGKGPGEQKESVFERKLYVIRKVCERTTDDLSEDSADYFYFASLSSRTVVYKGMLTAQQVPEFYTDLRSLDYESALALVHSRYSTNTFPSWERAHPYRYLIHNGEINTLRGNINRMKAREAGINTELFGPDSEKIFPIINPNGSDSAMFDNCLEFLSLTGRNLPHAAMMMVPEPWDKHEEMSDLKKAFYEFHNFHMEPWDGPCAAAFTDGKIVAATLDRNGLRPSRYYITKSGRVILSSEAGVMDIPPEQIESKERLRPGRMLIIDTLRGRIVSDDEIKQTVAREKPYRKWINKNVTDLQEIKTKKEIDKTFVPTEEIRQKQEVFGYTYEELHSIVLPMAQKGLEPIGAMGSDIPIAILSDRPQLLFNYFRQLFAQVTNPPVDAIREDIVISTRTYLGLQTDILDPKEDDCRQIKLDVPILANDDIERIQNIDSEDFKVELLPILFEHDKGGQALEKAMDELFNKADKAIEEGVGILILSDKGYTEKMAPIPSVLAVSGLHHHLIRTGKRTKVNILVQSGEPREVHHMAVLIGYGAAAVNPYMAFESIYDLIGRGHIDSDEIKPEQAFENYIRALTKGIVKVISKMGISTIQSYASAQIFEALGISKPVIDKYFTATPSRIGGITMETIALEVSERHKRAYNEREIGLGLESGGVLRWRSDGEYHQFNPLSVYYLQKAVRDSDYKVFKEYSSLLNGENQKLCTLRGLLKLNYPSEPIPLEEVESVDSIVKRFKTGAMSYGSISKEAHEALAIAMNRLSGKSNTGEGGEDTERFDPLPNNDSKCSAIKQIASGRFGVTGEYLLNAKEIQIKMAQGAKPGEGGQLPGEKVYPWIAKTRHSTPGVGLVSPPPHHDIYSIEDLAELIYDLKNANPDAEVSVKLVSEIGVGTVAAGVVKAGADLVLISGCDGGTGASPATSIRYAGLPWELGVAETHQTLMLNDLRSRIKIETDGKLMTGRDVVIAALLGAEEFGFSTAPLVALGCVMMRVCNLDTCPVGVATQNPELRKKFKGEPEHVVNFMRFIAMEMREIMAKLGCRTVEEMVGRTELIQSKTVIDHWTGKDLDLSGLLYIPEECKNDPRHFISQYIRSLENTLDGKVLIPFCKSALTKNKKIKLSVPIRNVDRTTGTLLGSEITRKYKGAGLDEDTINLHFKGSAGQSFGAFIPPGMTLDLEGDANDYIGKGLSGGKIIVRPDEKATFSAKDNIIIGNVAFYGATGGEAYIRGSAGERFCVRNSGAKAVVEGVGDHGCEYMTGGVVIVLGTVGRNFAAGMFGGTAYVLDTSYSFENNCNKDTVNLYAVTDESDKKLIMEMVEKHVKYTGSKDAKILLENPEEMFKHFIKVMPKDYERMLMEINRQKKLELKGEKLMLAAFEAIKTAASK